MPKNSIIIVREIDPVKRRQRPWSAKNQIVMSTDFFKTEKLLLTGGNTFSLTTNYMYAGRLDKDGNRKLVIALRHEQFSQFYYTSQFKMGEKELDYSVIESESGAVFLYVKHDGHEDRGTVYISDAHGKSFSPSFKDTIRTEEGLIDFEEIASLEGVIIANQEFDKFKYEDSSIHEGNVINKGRDRASRNNVKNQRSRFSNERETISKQNAQKQAKANAQMREQQKGRHEDNVKSYISFNRGGKWQTLNPPEVSSHGQALNCHEQKDCSLHLHSFSTEVLPYPYSTESAIGLIMGVGNLGKELSYTEEELNTYLSRDGGMTWHEIKKGPYIMEFGDHGSIIVIAPMFKPTRQVSYSLDYGKTWETVIISDSMVDIDNIIVEPQSISSKFIIHGHYSNSQDRKGLIVSLDFNQLGVRQCVGSDRPGD